jgi:hypothetical protein
MIGLDMNRPISYRTRDHVFLFSCLERAQIREDSLRLRCTNRMFPWEHDRFENPDGYRKPGAPKTI